jgi:gamma-glutamylcyclotransferase (GGCT)/AIG2-like uncharacterized protein YtfP
VIPDFDPRSYPGPRPPGPVLVHQGTVHPLVVDGPVHDPLRLASGGPTSVSAPAPGALRWSVAYGSNASPGRLVAKGLDRAGAVLLPARMRGFAPAFEHRRTGYGSVPLTLVPDPGSVHETWVLGIPAEATHLLDLTEGRVPGPAPRTIGSETGDGRFAPPGTYRLAPVGEVAVAGRFALHTALAYLPGAATRVQVTGSGAWRTWPASDQAAAGAHIEVTGPDRPVPEAEDPVLGDWPETTLRDLPLFVYGTLRPDGTAFGRIADLVDVLGPASTSGALFDTGLGWPTAVFGGGDGAGTIRGYLVAARGPSQARTLFDRVDRYEGVPEQYTRTSVLVDRPTGLRWAAGYAWAGGASPGERLPAGEWVMR